MMQSKCILFVFIIAAPILAHGCNHSNCCVLSVVRTVNRPYIFHTSYFVKCGQQNTFLLLETKTSHPFLLHIPIRLFLFLKYQQDRYFFSCVPCQVEYHQGHFVHVQMHIQQKYIFVFPATGHLYNNVLSCFYSIDVYVPLLQIYKSWNHLHNK